MYNVYIVLIEIYNKMFYLFCIAFEKEMSSKNKN